jgi:TolA-binding protein
VSAEHEATGTDGDLLLDELTRLARLNLSGDAPRRGESSFARVVAKLEGRRARRRSTMLLAAASFAVLFALGGATWLWQRQSAVTYSVVNGMLVDGDVVVGGADTKLRFSEGSELTLEPGAETRIIGLDAHGGRLSLQDGTAQVAIAKRPGAAWSLAAGPYTVKVTGTAFSLRWSRREQALEIAMKSGSVVVTGPYAGTGMALHAGQRLRGSLATGKLTVDASSQTDPGAPVAKNLAGVDAAAPEDPALEAKGPAEIDAAGALPGRVELGWAQKAAAGDFRGVVDSAMLRGIAPTLAGAPLSDLSALADSARYLRQTDLARQTLLAQRKRFPKSGAARDAAFFLGRIAEDQGDTRGATDWYDRYFADAPGGSYASQALGRKLMLVYRQGGAEGARAIALAYLERFPSGPYAAAAKNIVREVEH